MPGHAHRITSEAFSPDGQRIVSGSQDCTVGIYACRPSEMNGHFNEVTSVAFLPDGQRIVLGSNGKSVRVWSPKRRAAPRDARPYLGRLQCGVLPDGHRVVATRQRGSGRLGT
eukprot:CAMPEP_0202104004 /NCGR_PEP_ID=MMETSP0965-20130614/5219_1 /ASSEMBLY_ACC=CAM_ASM_000507 /TAXON_ID=4773 /ORGANISM="Schizochytrium aggregatum, Strain ATCC28209" /LENGTH=112 /DNA_ID=CAMNT_0048672835 /DNA_START=208 /DNA_END=546 /DNA_ORIENTATION=+